MNGAIGSCNWSKSRQYDYSLSHANELKVNGWLDSIDVSPLSFSKIAPDLIDLGKWLFFFNGIMEINFTV